MNIETIVLAAYNRAIRRHEKRVGEQYPLIRTSCVEITKRGGMIYDTNVSAPQNWRLSHSNR
jgi:hypothetical protein